MKRASRNHERFLRAIVANAVGECSSCHSTYDVDSVSVLGHQDALWFFGLQCEQCRTQGLVAAQIVDGVGTAVAPLPATNTTTVSEAPQTKEAAQPSPVSGQDVREIRGFLAEFDGDFGSLFSRKDE